MDNWYHCEDDGTELRVEFITGPDRFWPTTVVRARPLPAEAARGRSVVLTGKGAVWMYAHAAAVFRAAGAYSIRTETPSKPGNSDDLTGCESLLILAGRNDELGALLKISLRSSPPLSPAAVDQLVKPRLDELRRLRSPHLVVSGRAGVDIYARIAWTAVDSEVRRLTCWSARDGLVVVHDPAGGLTGQQVPRPTWLAEAMPRPSWPVILGVVGDPNRGKSVFSGALDSFREQIGADGWKLDCDGQSPTPAWYLSLIGEAEAEALRREQKRGWTPEMEAQIVKQLQASRELFSVLVADLPGGNHKVQPPERLPPGRERMFAEVDAFILLDGPAGASEAAWRSELRRHGLEDRIAAVLTSCDPDQSPSLSVHSQGGVWRGIVTGLNRTRPAWELSRAFRSGLEELWPALLRFARRRAPAPPATP
ncbi:MAG: hypothetical protein NZ700_00965 [Gemmataceae bacterium]|nr:hypothetical protein [Gemmataceae bacterium]MDW8265787.1 hypothetical protein [Gemmataceae bacterium]